MAAEKAKLVEALPADGLAVLNADDPLVAAMAGATRARVVFFGRSPDAHLRIVEASSAWPDRLTLRLAYKGRESLIHTRYVADTSALSVAASLLAAFELGADRAACEAVAASTEPLFNKMSVHQGQSGEWYVLDAAKASFSGLKACLAFLAGARAPRKTVVFGTISDHAGASRQAYYAATRAALEHADRVFFTGPNALRPRRLAGREFAGRIVMEEDYARCIARLRDDVVADELIYVKASRVDKLERRLAPAFRELP
jgi:UDP-N-acetylmuramoyl-tripeptide--D-alanyl-D-alanine ligase